MCKIIVYFSFFFFSFLLANENNNKLIPYQKEKILNQEEDKKLYNIGMLIDTYYTANLNYPAANDRNYMVKANRNNEFNINLLHIDLNLTQEKYRGRAAVQYGTAVNANYITESSTDKYSNQFSVRNIQEAYGGVRLGKKVWMDMGIFFSHLGFSSWISNRNWNYSRGFMADFSPYYASGIRITNEISSKLELEFYLIDGWSQVSDINKSKSIGTQIDYDLTNHLTFVYNTYLGDESAKDRRIEFENSTYSYEIYKSKQMRYFQNFIVTYKVNDRLDIASAFDIGFQNIGYKDEYFPDGNYYRKPGTTYSRWYGSTIWMRYKVNNNIYSAFRIEKYIDPQNTIVPIEKKSEIYSINPAYRFNGFHANGVTLGMDYLLDSHGLLRFEGKYNHSPDPIFDYKNGNALSRHEKLLIFNITIYMDSDFK
jgi:hypothetical protein